MSYETWLYGATYASFRKKRVPQYKMWRHQKKRKARQELNPISWSRALLYVAFAARMYARAEKKLYGSNTLIRIGCVLFLNSKIKTWELVRVCDYLNSESVNKLLRAFFSKCIFPLESKSMQNLEGTWITISVNVPLPLKGGKRNFEHAIIN